MSKGFGTTSVQHTRSTTHHMFTSDHIAQAHSRVKSGADLPRHVQDLTAHGGQCYTNWLTDGHTVYEGQGQQLSTVPKTADQTIADIGDQAHLHERSNCTNKAASTSPPFAPKPVRQAWNAGWWIPR